MSKKKNSGIIKEISYPYQKDWDLNQNYAHVDIQGIDLSIVNSLRRTIISKITTVGIKTEPYDECDIDIVKNDSPLHNQFLNQRLGMIPLYLQSEIEQDKLDDYEFILEVSNNTNFPKDITSEDFKIRQISTNTFLPKETVHKIFPPDIISKDYILITRLKPKYYQDIPNITDELKEEFRKSSTQVLNNNLSVFLKIKLSKGNGALNGRFNPSTVCCFVNKIDPQKYKINKEKYITDSIQKDKDNGLTPSTKEKLGKMFDTSHKARYFHTNHNDEPDQFIFKCESVGVIPPLIIIHKGIQLLINTLDNLLQDIKSDNNDVVVVEQSKNSINGYLLIIQNQNDTIGNLIQSNFVNYYGLGSDNELLKYCGYHKSHPLKDEIKLEIEPNKNMKWVDVINDIIDPGFSKIKLVYRNLLMELENTIQFNSEINKYAKLNKYL